MARISSKLDIALALYARETAADMGEGYLDAVGAMRMDAGEVARGVQCSADQVIAWCDGQQSAALRDALAAGRKVVEALLDAETTHAAPDARRVLRSERMKLQTAIARGDVATIVSQATEAEHVRSMWV